MGTLNLVQNYDDYDELISEGNVDENGKKQGKWTYYEHSEGHISEECFYQDDIKHGLSSTYHNDEVLTIASHGEYVNGLREGDWYFYSGEFPYSLTSHGKFVLDKPEGLWRVFINGKIEEQSFSNGEEVSLP